MKPKPVCVAGPTETPLPPIHRQSLISKPNYARFEAPPCSLPPAIGYVIMYVENQANGHSPPHRAPPLFLRHRAARKPGGEGGRGGGPTASEVT